jgi:hypothetical protein
MAQVEEPSLNKKNKKPPQVVSNQKRIMQSKDDVEIFEFRGVAGAREQQS